MIYSKLTFVSILTLAASIRASACDLCGCYTPSHGAIISGSSGFYFGAAEQFTRFGSLRLDGHEVDNPTGQYLNSSITQIVIGKTFLEGRLGLQLNVPLIYRSFKRPEGFETDRGHESGLGDISLLANYLVFQKDALFRNEESGYAKDSKNPVRVSPGEPDFTMSLRLLGGLKVPTGDSSRLKEEFEEVEVEGAPESGIHGHDLALGTGSYDAIFGAQFFTRYRSWFFQADTQFTLRGDGRHSYHFANDLTWSGGPGYYFIRKGNDSLALQFVVSGEYKDTDRFQGREAEDTGITSLYFGPQIIASLGKVNGEIGLDLPVLIHNTALQAVPDYRIRAGFSVHF